MRSLLPAQDLADDLAPYAAVDRAARGERPYVLANMVGGLDGTAAIGGRVGALSDPADARLFLELRSLADVVLVGAGTVRREGYGPVRLDPRLSKARADAGRSSAPALAVVSRSLELDWSLPLFAQADPDARPVVVTCAAADPDRLEQAHDHARVLVAGDGQVDLPHALRQLRQLGNDVVLCEGGPTLLGEVVAQDLLDELCLSIAPLMGGDALPLAVTPCGGGTASFALAHVLVEGSTLFLRYERSRT